MSLYLCILFPASPVSESESDVSPEKRARVGELPEVEEESSSSSSSLSSMSTSSSLSRSGSKQRSRKRCHRCQTKLELVQQELGSCRCGMIAPPCTHKHKHRGVLPITGPLVCLIPPQLSGMLKHVNSSSINWWKLETKQNLNPAAHIGKRFVCCHQSPVKEQTHRQNVGHRSSYCLSKSDDRCIFKVVTVRECVSYNELLSPGSRCRRRLSVGISFDIWLGFFWRSCLWVHQTYTNMSLRTQAVVSDTSPPYYP